MKNTIHNVNVASKRSRQGQSVLEIVFRVRHHGQVCRKAPQRKRTGTSVWAPRGTRQEPRALFSFALVFHTFLALPTEWNHTGTTQEPQAVCSFGPGQILIFLPWAAYGTTLEPHRNHVFCEEASSEIVIWAAARTSLYITRKEPGGAARAPTQASTALGCSGQTLL